MNPNPPVEESGEESMSITDTNQNKDYMNRIPVSRAFSENGFRLFLQFCEEQEIHYVDELSDLDPDILLSIQGMGKGKLQKIQNRLDELKKDGELLPIGQETPSQRMEMKKAETIRLPEMFLEKLNPGLEEWDISFLEGLGFRRRWTEILHDAGYTKLKELTRISKHHVATLIGKKNVSYLGELRSEMVYPPEKILNRILEKRREDRRFMAIQLRAKGYTLQRIGDEMDLTRERVRQIINQFLNELSPILRPIIDKRMARKGYIRTAKILDICTDDDFDRIVIFWCRNSKQVQYFDVLDLFLPKERSVQEIEQDVLQYAEEMVGDGLVLNTRVQGEIEYRMRDMGYPFIKLDGFIAMLLKHGYTLYRNFITKGKQSYGYLCARCIAEHFPEGIKLYESDDLKKLREYVRAEYGVDKAGENDRALSTRLSNYTVLCDRGAVTAVENVHINIQLLERIRRRIDEIPEAEIYYADLFSEFEEPLRNHSNVNNYNFLHGVLKLYYSDMYDFSSRNHLTKRGEGLSSGRVPDRLNAFIREKGRPVSKKEIKERIPGITGIVLFGAISADSELMQWDYNKFTSLSVLNISEEDRAILWRTLDSVLNQNDGYCSESRLYREFRELDVDFQKRMGIHNPHNLFFLCGKLYGNQLDFARPHIARKGQFPTMSTVQILMHYFRNATIFQYEDFVDTVRRLEWNPTTSLLVFSDLERNYIRTNQNTYVQKNLYLKEQSEGFLEQVAELLEKRVGTKYFSLIHFDGWEDFPACGQEWNPFLLRSLVERCLSDYEVVDTRRRDRRYERGIIVPAGEGGSLEDLVVRLLQKRDIHELSEAEMLKFMLQEHLVYKMIPKELYLGQRMKYRNETFYVPEK